MQTRSRSPRARAPSDWAWSPKPTRRSRDARPAARGLASRLALLIAGATLGCHHRPPPPAAPPPPPVLGAISIEIAAPDDDEPPPVDPEAVRAALRERLLHTALFAGSGGDAAAPVRADVDVRILGETVEVGATGEARARVAVSIASRPTDAPGAFSAAQETAGTQRYAAPSKRAPGASVAAATETALAIRLAGELVDAIAARRRLHDGPPSAVHAALTADAGELRQEAIEAAGERHLSDEAPLLLKLLDDPDERTRDAALGALIALGDRRAVSALTRTRSLRDRREMKKIIEAVSILGGQEADEYLSFVAASHDDDDIRIAAAAARERLLRRQGGGGNSGS